MRGILKDSPVLVKICLGLLAAVLLIVLFAGFLMPYDPDATSLLERNLPPVFLGGSAEHLLGTDELGLSLIHI